MDHDDYLAILRLFEDEVVPEKQIQNQLPQQSDPESKQAQHPHLCPPRSIGPPEPIEISTPSGPLEQAFHMITRPSQSSAHQIVPANQQVQQFNENSYSTQIQHPYMCPPRPFGQPEMIEAPTPIGPPGAIGLHQQAYNRHQDHQNYGGQRGHWAPQNQHVQQFNQNPVSNWTQHSYMCPPEPLRPPGTIGIRQQAYNRYQGHPNWRDQGGHWPNNSFTESRKW